MLIMTVAISKKSVRSYSACETSEPCERADCTHDTTTGITTTLATNVALSFQSSPASNSARVSCPSRACIVLTV